MIEDIGRVVKIIDRKAAVKVERTAACALKEWRPKEKIKRSRKKTRLK
jgi:hypothetical protein